MPDIGAPRPKKKATTVATKGVSVALRNAVASGDPRAVDQIARSIGLSDRDRAGLTSYAKTVKPTGLLNKLSREAGSILGGTPRGIANLAKSAAEEIVVKPALLPLRVAQGKNAEALRSVPFVGQGIGLAEGFTGRTPTQTNPLSSLIGASYRNTAERVAHPTQAAKDYGNAPISSFLEDVGNIAPVLGGASKLAKVGGLAKTSEALAELSRVGNRTAAAPFIPTGLTAKAANAILARGAESLATRFPQAAAALRVTPEQLATKKILRAGIEAEGEAANAQVRQARVLEKILPKRAEQEAAFTIGQGEAQALAVLRRTSPQRFDQFVQEHFGGGLSKEGASLAADIVEGRTVPEVTARIDEALRLGREGTAGGMGRAAREQMQLERNAITPGQTGFEALSGSELPFGITKQVIEDAPARLRPVLAVNKAVTDILKEDSVKLAETGISDRVYRQAAADLPTTLDDLRKAGVNPDHFIHIGEDAGGTSRGGASNAPTLPRTGRTRAERRRTGKTVPSRTIRSQTKAEIDEVKGVIRNRTAQTIASQPWAKKAGDLGFKTIREAETAGYVGWDPKNITEKVTTLRPDTVLLPEPVFRQFKSYFNDPHWDDLLSKTYDRGTTGFKHVVLSLSPAWNVGNTVGNVLMATLAGDVSPARLAVEIGSAIRTWKRTRELPGPERLRTSGSTHETLDYLRPGDQPGRVAKVAMWPIRAGYKVNQVVDDILRSAVYTAKLKKGASPELALRQSLRAMGDFTNLSPFERRVVRRIIPFYAWQKHLFQLGVTLPIEHPLRTALTLHLADAFNDEDAWEGLLPDYMRSGVPIGNSVLQTGGLFPFSTPFSGVSNLASNLNPIIKFGLANAPVNIPGRGINAFTGRPYTRPPGTGRHDEMGRPEATAPSIVEQLRQIPPQIRFLDMLTGRKDVARYESGDEVKVRNKKTGKLETLPVKNSTAIAVARFFGLPLRDKKDLEEIANAIIERRVAEYKSAHPEAQVEPVGSSKKKSASLVAR